ncbi:MAG: hypothetical protein ACQCN6_03925 [Candidatus Bathyarchaeia archaeon]
MTVTVEALVEQFGEPRVVAPWGECLVIPTAQFQEEWRGLLAGLGLVCRFGSWDRQSVVFVQLKRVVPQGKVVYVPPPKAVELRVGTVKSVETPPPAFIPSYVEVKEEVNEKFGKKWTSEEDKRLLEVIGDVTYGVINVFAKACTEGKFPGRNANGCQQRLEKLRRAASKAKASGSQVTVSDEKALAVVIAQGITTQRIIDLEKSVVVLQEAYDAVSKGYVELRSKLEDGLLTLEKQIDVFAAAGLTSSQDKMDELTEKLAKHKHAAGSGETMLPMEASE